MISLLSHIFLVVTSRCLKMYRYMHINQKNKNNFGHWLRSISLSLWMEQWYLKYAPTVIWGFRTTISWEIAEDSTIILRTPWVSGASEHKPAVEGAIWSGRQCASLTLVTLWWERRNDVRHHVDRKALRTRFRNKDSHMRMDRWSLLPTLQMRFANNPPMASLFAPYCALHSQGPNGLIQPPLFAEQMLPQTECCYKVLLPFICKLGR